VKSSNRKEKTKARHEPHVTTTTTTTPALSTRAGQIALLGASIDPKDCAFAKNIESMGFAVQEFEYSRSAPSLVLVASQNFSVGFGPDTAASVLAGELALSSGIWAKSEQSLVPLGLPSFDVQITIPGALGSAPQTGHFVCPAAYMVGLANGQQSASANFDAACGGPPPPFAGITLSAFDQIQTGMSYEQVTAIVGAPGTLSAETNVAGFDTKIYTWPGAGGVGANANVEFQNDQEVSKAQAGLG